MESIRELFKVGSGPSSSHTIGPEKASEIIKKEYPNMSYKVTLFGSLALTGKGHLTDYIIYKTLGKENTEVLFDINTKTDHPNTMRFDVYDNDKLIASRTFVSIGGGSIIEEGKSLESKKNIYPHTTFNEIKDYVTEKNMTLPEYVYEVEGEDIKDFLFSIYKVMENTLKKGLEIDGVLPGGLKVKRKAKAIFESDIPEYVGKKNIIIAYAYSVAEANASGETIVTAPTCGSSGVVPACLYYLRQKKELNYTDVIDALAVAGLIGNVVKENASISGAYAGCQAEIGTACSMAAAMIAYLDGLKLYQIEAAAEIAMEHHLGLTCDPVNGLVQIPCIERNAIAALRAFDAVTLATLPIFPQKLSFDSVVKAMLNTGRDINEDYKETARGGLAKTDIRGI